jgi:hypothetical protein
MDQGLKIRSEAEVTTGKNRKHSGTNKNRQRLPQSNASSPTTKERMDKHILKYKDSFLKLIIVNNDY